MKASKLNLNKLIQMTRDYMADINKVITPQLLEDMEILRHSQTLSEFLANAETLGYKNTFIRSK